MARIFYGVQGEGLGHATRSKTLIESLQKKHEIIIFCGGRAYTYLSKHFKNVIRITSPHIFYRKNSASSFRTIILNTIKVPEFLKSYIVVRKEALKKSPDIIITDFEPITCYFGNLNKIPIISVDNQHVITKSRIEYPRKMWWQYLKTKFIVRIMIPKADKYFMINFFFPQVHDKDASFVGPIIRKEIEKGKPKKKNFILVYQTSFTDTHLVPSLMATGEKMVIYGNTVAWKEKNIEFREFDEKHFFEDIMNCKAVITNGGQSLMCEAIFLNKPVLSVPVENQFEQYVNAVYLEKLGYGEYHEKINSESIKTFLNRIPAYEKNLKKNRLIGNRDLVSKIQNIIPILIKENRKQKSK